MLPAAVSSPLTKGTTQTDEEAKERRKANLNSVIDEQTVAAV